MKNDLTKHQKEFLLSFFENDKYVGWRNIATKLLENGSCIVAGNENIWYGGIGNFIKTEINENAIGCLTYSFDLEYFKTSMVYKSTLAEAIKLILKTKEDIELRYSEINNL